jgi:hypothetical protein
MIHHSLNEIAALIGLIYEAAYDRSRWQKVVTDLGDLFDGSRTCISRFRQNSVDAVMSLADPDMLSRDTIEALCAIRFTVLRRQRLSAWPVAGHQPPKRRRFGSVRSG